MNTSMTRRNALKTGAVTAGAIAGAVRSGTAEAASKSPSHPSFLSPWSPPEDLKRDLTSGTTPIRLACSAYRLTYTEGADIAGMVKHVRDMGYSSSGDGYGLFNRNPWLDVPETSIRELKDALKRHDVVFFDMHAAINNIHPDLGERRKINQWLIEQMEAAERVECPMVTTHVGSRSPGAVYPHPLNWTRETWDLSIKVMRQLVKDTAGMKCVFGIEPDSLVQVNNPRSCRQLVDDCGPRVQICLDPVNMSNLEYHYRKTEYINECFDLLGEDIFACHAKDIALKDSLQPVLYQVEPGQGTMDYDTYLARLSRLKWPRTLFLEHLAAERYPDVKRFIVETADRVGARIYE